ncbi:hypothetical protein [Bosea sp. NPDC055594]
MPNIAISGPSWLTLDLEGRHVAVFVLRLLDGLDLVFDLLLDMEKGLEFRS